MSRLPPVTFYRVPVPVPVTGKHNSELMRGEARRERAFALAFLDVDVGVLTPVLLL